MKITQNHKIMLQSKRPARFFVKWLTNAEQKFYVNIGPVMHFKILIMRFSGYPILAKFRF